MVVYWWGQKLIARTYSHDVDVAKVDDVEGCMRWPAMQQCGDIVAMAEANLQSEILEPSSSGLCWRTTLSHGSRVD